MPNVIYLHSALTTELGHHSNETRLRAMLRSQRKDVALALGLAGLINVLMVIVAAATFHVHGLSHTVGIEQAYRTLTPILGSGASVIFAVALLASGLSSSAVGTFAGQAVLHGFLRSQTRRETSRRRAFPSLSLAVLKSWSTSCLNSSSLPSLMVATDRIHRTSISSPLVTCYP
jgi:NRAMP (natural resistance-associated macrophage protein)-like metal ion transporter